MTKKTYKKAEIEDRDKKNSYNIISNKDAVKNRIVLNVS